MKKFSILILLSTLLTTAAMAATYSGVITDANTGMPVANQRVYLLDSTTTSTTFAYLDSALTNSSGAYSFAIPASLPTTNSHQLDVYLKACGTDYYCNHIYNGSSAVCNFQVCAPSSRLCILDGRILRSTPDTPLYAMVYLIAVTSINASTGDTTIAAIDSFATNSTGAFSRSVTVISPLLSSLRLKAALLPSDTRYANYLPTYYSDTQRFSGSSPLTIYGSALSWSNAIPLTSAKLYADFTVINMIAGTNPGGPGFIGGSVLLGANKSTAVGDPLSKRLLLLTKSTGEAVAYTYSDAAGHFQFPSLPYGSYKLFGDALGKTNPALSITLSAATPKISNVVFQENNKSFKGSIGSLNAGSAGALDGIRVAPNPATDYVSVSGLGSISGEKTVVLRDITGAEISRRTMSGGEGRVALAGLPSGIYILQVQTSAGAASFRIAK